MDARIKSGHDGLLEDTPSRSRRAFRASFARNVTPLRTEGAGKTGCALHPRSRVQIRNNKKRTRAYRFSGNTPAFPAQWFYDLLRALPGDRAFLPPSPPRSLLLRNLTPASGCQDHTTSSSAWATLVSRCSRVHRIPPRVRDDREPPLCVGRDAQNVPLIWGQEQSRRDATFQHDGQISNGPSQAPSSEMFLATGLDSTF
jgi:hypothetical protein